MEDTADNPEASYQIEQCANCGKRFTSYVNAPTDIAYGQPHRHELFPNDVLCIDCFVKADRLADGAFA
jgi:hypothetical protein